MRVGDREFEEIWLVDFEFRSQPGERPEVVCLVGLDLISGKKTRIWKDELIALEHPPYAVDENSLFVAYYASAEINCHLALGWPVPVNVLDLYAEFRNLTNGLRVPCGNSLLGAMTWFGLSSIDAAEKDSMRDLVLRGAPWTPEERMAVLDYCESDVIALSQLMPAMLPSLEIGQALLRGRYMNAAAQMEHVGIPIDGENLTLLRRHWTQLQEMLIDEVDQEYGVFVGRRFVRERFRKWLAANGIAWPVLPSGQLDLSDATFRERAEAHPILAALRELRVSLSQMRLSDLAVGGDGRNRCMLSAFRARTGRNQPSNSQFVFGTAVWLRGLIKPREGSGVAYIDYSQQEFAIAAALSGDPLMIKAYESGDPYLEFAKQAGAVPLDATKETHKAERDRFKACVLAVQYGMGPQSLAQRIDQPAVSAKLLLEKHKSTYSEFWRWSDGVRDHAMLFGGIWTVFGWRIQIGDSPNPRSIRNFPMQANGAEMLRLACCLATEAGIRVCAPVHDALLVEAPLDELSETVERTQELMGRASEIVLNGFRLRTDAEIFSYPDRYEDSRGTEMWDRVQRTLSSLRSEPNKRGRECNVS